MVSYPAMLDVPRELVCFLADLLAASRRAGGTRRGARKLSCFGQALLVLVWFRERRDVALTGKGFGISQATAYRYRDEVIGVLAAQAPGLVEALRRVAEEGWSHVILDGKVVDADRCATKITSTKGKTIDAWYSGKTRDFGGNIQGLTRPDRFPIWIGDVEPGSTHDITAARAHALPACYAAASQLDLPTLADPGYDGAGAGVYTPVKQPADGRVLDVEPAPTTRCCGRCAASANAASPLLTGRWRTLQHVTASPSKIGDIANAALVLTHFEHDYLAW